MAKEQKAKSETMENKEISLKKAELESYQDLTPVPE